MKPAAPLLVADIGGTNARFAVARVAGGEVELDHVQSLPAREHPSLLLAVASYLDSLPHRPTSGVLAVAGPVTDGTVDLTNSPWQVSDVALETLGLSPVRLINDFEALAAAAPRLPSSGLSHLGGPLSGAAEATLAVMGPGTGFGVSILGRAAGGHSVAMATEGGHAAFAPADAVEEEIVRVLWPRFGRVSIERLLCGPGLINLHSALAEIEGRPAPQTQSPADITAQALADASSPEAATLTRFCAMLGSVAGEIALTTGARGGVYIAGGIAPRILPFLKASPFRQRFEAKGRYSDYLAAIPTWVITHPYPALLGAALSAARE